MEGAAKSRTSGSSGPLEKTRPLSRKALGAYQAIGNHADMEEEEEAEVTRVSGTVGNLIEVLRQAHLDNGKLYYYGTPDPRKRGHKIMPVTPFVFELFIYNSIYQVDWPASLEARRVVNHPRDAEGFTETKQQRELEKFLKPHVREAPALLYEAFLPIRDASLEGDWTPVVPDARISAEEGERFFEGLRSLRDMLLREERPQALRASNQCFDLIAECRRIVYLVRNNIFHGSKTLGETYEPNQQRRIELYLTFLRCMNKLFFSVCDKIGVETASNPSMQPTGSAGG